MIALLRLVAFNIATRLMEWAQRPKRETQWLASWAREVWR